MEKDNDEKYIIDLCDKVLNLESSRHYRFDFLVGDKGKNGRCSKLPVDAYYKELNLVIEYCEKQHTEIVPIFDNKITVSGVSRGEQRKIYDERRRTELPKNGIQLIEISYYNFNVDGQKRIKRNLKQDMETIENIFKKHKIIQ